MRSQGFWSGPVRQLHTTSDKVACNSDPRAHSWAVSRLRHRLADDQPSGTSEDVCGGRERWQTAPEDRILAIRCDLSRNVTLRASGIFEVDTCISSVCTIHRHQGRTGMHHIRPSSLSKRRRSAHCSIHGDRGTPGHGAVSGRHQPRVRLSEQHYEGLQHLQCALCDCCGSCRRPRSANTMLRAAI